VKNLMPLSFEIEVNDTERNDLKNKIQFFGLIETNKSKVGLPHTVPVFVSRIVMRLGSN
jgi:hypothetical protein